jgi:hypothetical protein
MARSAKIIRLEVYRIETAWLQEFARFHGSDRITSYCLDDLNSVPLVRIRQALIMGRCIYCEKCDGPGTECTVEHIDDDGVVVRVKVHFESNTDMLKIINANYVEINDEPEAA